MASPVATDTPGVIDLTYLESSSFGEADLVLRAIDMLLDLIPEQLERLTRAVAERDWALARLAAHTLKSAAGMLGMEPVRAALRAIESYSAGEPEAPSEITPLAAEVSRFCALAVEELSAERGRYARPS